MRITEKQRSGYIKAKREWVSDNDDYNMRHFGITKETYEKNSSCLYRYKRYSNWCNS